MSYQVVDRVMEKGDLVVAAAFQRSPETGQRVKTARVDPNLQHVKVGRVISVLGHHDTVHVEWYRRDQPSVVVSRHWYAIDRVIPIEEIAA